MLLDDCENVVNKEVKDKSTREIKHNYKHHKRHHERHLARRHRGEVGLVGFDSILSVFHHLAESLFLAFFLVRECGLASHPELNKSGNDTKRKNCEVVNIWRRENGICGRIEVYETEDLRVKIISRIRIGFEVFQIIVLFIHNFIDTIELRDWLVSASGNIITFGRENHTTDRAIESEENRELDKNREERTEWFYVVALIKLEGLDRFELAIPFCVFLYLGELGLDFSHLLCLIQLALYERPHADFYKDCENNNRDTEIADVIIDNKKNVYDWADDYCVD